MKRRSPPWSHQELEVLRFYYPDGRPMSEILKLLPNRSKVAIHNKCRELKVKRPKGFVGRSPMNGIRALTPAEKSRRYYQKRKALGLGPTGPAAKKWTEEEDRRLKLMWETGIPAKQVFTSFPGRTEVAVKVRTITQKLRRPKWYRSLATKLSRSYGQGMTSTSSELQKSLEAEVRARGAVSA